MKKKLLVLCSVLMIAAMAVALTACGGKSGGGDTPAPAGSGADSGEAKTLSMATNAAFPPYEYMEGNEYAGIDIEIAKAIADYMGAELVINDVEFGSIIGGVQSGKYDMGMALVLNNQIVDGGTNEGGKYSHIVRAATGNFFMYSSESLTELKKDGKMTFTKKFPAGNHKLEDLTVVAFAIVPDGDRARMDNIVEVKAGKSADYILND